MDKNSLGKLYTLRESIVAAVTCTAHCNLNRVLILALDLLVLVILKDYNLKTTDKLVGSKLFHHLLSTPFIVVQNPKLQQTLEVNVACHDFKSGSKGDFKNDSLRCLQNKNA